MVHPNSSEPVRVDLVPLKLVDQLELPVDQSRLRLARLWSRSPMLWRNAACSVTSRMFSTSPWTRGSSARLVQMLSVAPRPVDVLQPAPELAVAPGAASTSSVRDT